MLPPLWILIQDSLTTTDAIGNVTGWTLAHFRKLLTDRDALTSIWNTLVFAAGSTVLSLITGGILAWLVERTNAPLKILAYLATIISMGTPYILHVIAWLFLLGRVGPLNDLYRQLTGATGNIFEVNSMAGMILIEGFLWSPLVFLLLGATFRAANADMEEAARMSGASVYDTLRRISLPLAMPSILALALFVFIRAIGGFEVPALVGMPGRIYVLTTDVYEATLVMPPDLGYAAAFSVVMVVIVAVLLYYYSRLSKSAEKYHSVTGKGYRPRPFDLGRGRWIAGALILLNFVVVLLLPLLTLLWMSLLPFLRSFSLAALPTLTLTNYRTVLNAGDYVSLALNSLTVAAGAATAIMLLTALAGWIAARRGPGGRILDQLATSVAGVPRHLPRRRGDGGVSARAAADLRQRCGSSRSPMSSATCRTACATCIPACCNCIASWRKPPAWPAPPRLTTLRRIVAPLLTPALVAGWLFIFLIANKELSIAVLLASPGSQVIAVAIFDEWVNGQGGELAAFGLVWTALMTLIACLFFAQMRRGSTDVYGN